MDLAYTWLAIQALQSPMRRDHDASGRPGRSCRAISSDPSTCAFSPDVTLCTTIGRGLTGRPGTMINYVRTDEQTWSKHDPETAIDQGKEMVKTPGQDGCAARDLNPEPAD